MQMFKMRFLSALHVDSKGSGEPETAEEFIHSDTLSSAIALAWATLFRVTENDFFYNLPFRVSSAFPYVKGLLLFPAPGWNFWTHIDPAERKKTKKVKWLSSSLFSDVLKGKNIDPERTVFIPNGIALSEDEASSYPELKNTTHWKITERQRVLVDRLGIRQEGGLFFFALQFFSKDAGLYFIADVDEAIINEFRAALNYLGDTGIGADRNSGLGHFRVVDELEFTLQTPENPDGYITLSLFNPGTEDDIENLRVNSAYNLLTRSGWISNSTLGRPPIKIFAEGSYFSTMPQGRIVPMLSDEVKARYNLGIGHNAPRDFRAISVPCVKPSILKE